MGVVSIPVESSAPNPGLFSGSEILQEIFYTTPTLLGKIDQAGRLCYITTICNIHVFL